MHLSSKTRAWLTLVAAVVVVLLAVLLPRLTSGSTSTQPSARSSVTARASGTSSKATRTAKPTPPRSPTSRPTTPRATTASSGAWIAESDLDTQARRTLALIRAGGPFPYPRNDGVTYHNANRQLPSQRDGYYQEYTVPTPGSSSRGARRIIAGQGGDLWYTTDHYDSFRQIRVGA